MKSEFFLKVVNTLKLKDLANFKLVFVVYLPTDQEKKELRITETMVEQEPARYIFVPQYFIRLPLIDKVTGWILGGNSKEIILPLMKFNSSKYLQEQLEQESEVVTGCSLTV